MYSDALLAEVAKYKEMSTFLPGTRQNVWPENMEIEIALRKSGGWFFFVNWLNS